MIGDKNSHKAVLISLLLLIGFSDVVFSQIKLEHMYRARAKNRYKEGLKQKKKKLVSGTLKLTSLMIVDKAFMKKADAAPPETMQIFFDSPVAKGIKPQVYYSEKSYFMDPNAKFLKEGPNEFSWPAKIITDNKIPISGLKGIAKAKQGPAFIYFPIRLQSEPTGKLQAVLVPDKDMTLDITLTPAAGGESVFSLKNQKVISDQPFTVELPAVSGEFKLEAIEKAADGSTLRQHPFTIFLGS